MRGFCQICLLFLSFSVSFADLAQPDALLARRGEKCAATNTTLTTCRMCVCPCAAGFDCANRGLVTLVGSQLRRLDTFTNTGAGGAAGASLRIARLSSSRPTRSDDETGLYTLLDRLLPVQRLSDEFWISRDNAGHYKE